MLATFHLKKNELPSGETQKPDLALCVWFAHFSVFALSGIRAPLLNIFAEPIKDLRAAGKREKLSGS